MNLRSRSTEIEVVTPGLHHQDTGWPTTGTAAKLLISIILVGTEFPGGGRGRGNYLTMTMPV